MESGIKRLTHKEQLFVSTMLFGMFFGAGNLIFPVYMGELAGRNVWSAVIGFLITGVGIPLLGVAALGISRSNGLQEMSSRVGHGYGIFFTCALYLTIGPLFAIPRCASTSFTVGIEPLFGGENSKILLAVFSLVFFLLVLWFSLRPGKILVWVGKLLTPMFLVVLGILVVVALMDPIDTISQIEPTETYAASPLFAGFLDGYNTMDALASLAFGIVVVNVIREHGVTDPQAIAANTVKSGIWSCVFMGIVYLAVTVVGAQSRSIVDGCANGGEALAIIARHYLGTVGLCILALAVTLACLKTAVGLVTSCGEGFAVMFPHGPSYRVWAIIFCIVPFLIANIGLNAIISWSLPVLMLLFPLAITLILLALFGNFYNHNRAVYCWVTVFTFIAAFFDFLKSLPAFISQSAPVAALLSVVSDFLPFFDIGLGWVCPAVVGLVIGIIVMKAGKKRG